MKKINWTPIKEMLFTYLAINKIMYWMSVIFSAEGFYGVGTAVAERLLGRDIVLILLIVFMYAFEYGFVLKQKKWKGIYAQIIIILFGYVLYCAILIVYNLTLGLIFTGSFDISGLSGLLRQMPLLTVSYFIIVTVVTAKENLKKKMAPEYVSDSKSTEIKLEMLDELLDDGAISREECEKQKGKLLC